MKPFLATWTTQGKPVEWRFKARDLAAAKVVVASVVLASGVLVEEVKEKR